MKIYYISKVDGETCDLGTVRKKCVKTVNLTDLSELSKVSVIVGYNKITGSIEVKDSNSIIAYIDSKQKLAQKPTLSKYIEELGDTVIIDNYTKIMKVNEYTAIVDITDSKSTTFGIPSSLPYDYDCFLKSVAVDWGGITDKVVKEMNTRYEVNITYNLDIGEYVHFKSADNNYYLKYREMAYKKGSNLVKLNIVNKDMFANVETVDSFFDFTTTKFKVSSFDFSECKFSDSFTTSEFIKRNTFLSIPFHESFYNGKHSKLYRLGKIKNISVLYSLAKRYDYPEVLHDIVFGDLTYSELEELTKLKMLEGSDIVADNFIFNKPLNESTNNTIIPCNLSVHSWFCVTNNFDVDLDGKYIDLLIDTLNILLKPYETAFAWCDPRFQLSCSFRTVVSNLEKVKDNYTDEELQVLKRFGDFMKSKEGKGLNNLKKKFSFITKMRIIPLDVKDIEKRDFLSAILLMYCSDKMKLVEYRRERTKDLV